MEVQGFVFKMSINQLILEVIINKIDDLMQDSPNMIFHMLNGYFCWKTIAHMLVRPVYREVSFPVPS